MYKNKILYAQVREDPEIDRAAFRITPQDRLLIVTSGGCTALTLLADGPQEILCVDQNPAQNYLLELKITAIKHLNLQDGRRFFGARKGKARWQTYQGLRGHLSEGAKAYWDHHQVAIERGLLYAGVTERMTQRMPSLIFGLIHRPAMLRQLFRQESLPSQQLFYQDRWNNSRWQGVMSLAFHPWTFRLMYGKPFTERFGKGNLTQAWKQKIKRAFTEIPVRSNYFLSQLLWARYLPGEKGLPPYLRLDHYERIKASSGRLRWHTQDLVEFLRVARPGQFTKIMLSNAFEWLPKEKVTQAFGALAQALAPGGRATLRHLLAVTELPEGLPIRELQDLSEQLTRQERAFLYTRVSVYERT